MSVKNKLENKRARRMIRALRKGRTPAFINLLHWLQDHSPEPENHSLGPGQQPYADTNKKAEKLIRERRVRADSHVLGFRSVERDVMNEESGKTEKETTEVYDPRVPASVRGSIHVVPVSPVASST